MLKNLILYRLKGDKEKQANVNKYLAHSEDVARQSYRDIDINQIARVSVVIADLRVGLIA